MAFRTYRNVNLTLNGEKIFANSIVLNQEADIIHPVVVGERTSVKNIPNEHKLTSLSLEYYITGQDLIKDYIDQNESFTLTGNLNGLTFNEGYLENYSLNASPNSPVIVNASIVVADELGGTFAAATPTIPPDLKVVNYNDCLFVANGASQINPSVVTDFSWNYSTEITPVFYQADTGVLNSTPDRVIVGPRNINAELTTDSEDFDLNLSGQLFAIDLQARSPINTASYELYSVSGSLSRKAWNVSSSNSSRMKLSIEQSHTNRLPAINNIDSSNFVNTGYLTITSPNSDNGFFTRNGKYSLIEKVFLEDKECEFNVSRGASFDTITAYVPYDAINGYVTVQTSKNLIKYQTPFTGLDFPAIVVSGLRIDTGNFNDIVTLTGSNFYRISDVKIGSRSTNFLTSRDNVPSGSQHFLSFSIPPETRSDKIHVISSRRNGSGESSETLSVQPVITSLVPNTGDFNSVIRITGYNLNNINEVLFNEEVSPWFFVEPLGNSIRSSPPDWGGKFGKGQVKITGYKGMEAVSPVIYRPVMLINEVTALSGTIEEDFAIKTEQFIAENSLHRINDTSPKGFLVAFGNYTGAFYQSGAAGKVTLTGYAPTGIYGKENIALFEPDGVTLYPAYTGKYSQIGPPPVVDSVSPSGIINFETYDLNIFGNYMKDFFGLPYYVALSGHRDGSWTTYSDIAISAIQNKIVVSGVYLDTSTGYYDVYVVNAAGTGFATGLIQMAGADNLARIAAVEHFNPYLNAPEGVTSNSDIEYAPGYAVDSNDAESVTYSRTAAYANNPTGWYSMVFPNPINVNVFRTYRENIPSFVVERVQAKINNLTYWTNVFHKMSTGFRVEFFDVGGEMMEQRTGIQDTSLTYEISGDNFPTENDSYIATGVKQILIVGTGAEAEYGSNVFSAYGTITIFGKEI